jgi:hypothetical protein
MANRACAGQRQIPPDHPRNPNQRHIMVRSALEITVVELRSRAALRDNRFMAEATLPHIPIRIPL